jgi:hypothetical protein
MSLVGGVVLFAVVAYIVIRHRSVLTTMLQAARRLSEMPYR